MARMTQKPYVGIDVYLTLSEHEARALSLLASYDHGSVAKVFADNLSPDFTSKHRLGIMEFLEAVKRDIPPMLRRLDAAREVFDGRMIAVNSANSSVPNVTKES